MGSTKWMKPRDQDIFKWGWTKKHRKKLETLSQSNLICFKYGKLGHYKKYCKFKKKINNLNVSKDLKDMFYEVMLIFS